MTNFQINPIQYIPTISNSIFQINPHIKYHTNIYQRFPIQFSKSIHTSNTTQIHNRFTKMPNIRRRSTSNIDSIPGPVENNNFRNQNWSRNVLQFYYNGDQPGCTSDYGDDGVLDRNWWGTLLGFERGGLIWSYVSE